MPIFSSPNAHVFSNLPYANAEALSDLPDALLQVLFHPDHHMQVIRHELLAADLEGLIVIACGRIQKVIKPLL